MTKAQYSMEYLIMTAMMLIVLVPLIIVYFSHSKATQEELMIQQLEETGTELTKEADLVYYSGGFSKKTIEYNVPAEVRSIIFTNNSETRELTFIIETKEGQIEKVFSFNVPITANIPQNIENIDRFIMIKTESESQVLLCTNIECVEPVHS